MQILQFIKERLATLMSEKEDYLMQLKLQEEEAERQKLLAEQ